MKRAIISIAAFLLSLGSGGLVFAQPSEALKLQASSGPDLRYSDALIDSMLRNKQLRISRVDPDYMLRGRQSERLQQFHAGIPIFGADVVRDISPQGTQAVYGTVYTGLSVNTHAEITLDKAAVILRSLGGAEGTVLKPVDLMLVPLDSGRVELAYSSVVSGQAQVFRAFVSAQDGSELLRIDEIHTQAVGRGHGVLGDEKKISVLQESGVFVADDRLRPPVLITFDMRGNLFRARAVVETGASLFNSDRATDTDNNWTDPAVVDAHVHIGWTYDYLYKRFGRRGLDARDRPLVILTNAVTQQGALSLPGSLFGIWAMNAFWCGACGPGGVGLMFFGNGFPPGYYAVSSGQNVTYLAGALDVAAHELTHGVTSSSSNLIYRGESGALNESFSDILGTSVEFFYQRSGSGSGEADYLLGEDVFRSLRPGSLNGSRSLANPAMFGDPDHYSRRYLGTADGGGVHWNSGISNHAFYLAIEGGANRTSGVNVQGVGSANREQIEKVFFRAFVQLLPSNARFSTARAATIQAARDLYGAGSAAERAVTQAWTAVGVF